MTDSGPRFPVGTFVAEAGSWVLTFTDEGEFTFFESGRVDAVGTFSIKANELTWETDSYCDRGDAGKSTYNWTLEDDTLLFQVKGDDKCAERLAALDNVPYHREP